MRWRPRTLREGGGRQPGGDAHNDPEDYPRDAGDDPLPWSHPRLRPSHGLRLLLSFQLPLVGRSTRVLDKKSNQAPCEVNHGNLYDVLKDKFISLMLCLHIYYCSSDSRLLLFMKLVEYAAFESEVRILCQVSLFDFNA